MTYIVRKQRNGIVLILGKYDVIFLYVTVQRILHLGHIVLEELLGLFMGNAVFCIIFDLIVRAAGTVADGILLLIPVGILAEALLGFQQLHTLVTHSHIQCGGFLWNRHNRCNAANDQRNGKQPACHFLHCRSFPFHFMLPEYYSRQGRPLQEFFFQRYIQIMGRT